MALPTAAELKAAIIAAAEENAHPLLLQSLGDPTGARVNRQQRGQVWLANEQLYTVLQGISGALIAGLAEVAANITKVNGNAVNTGNGVAGAGTLRVTTASDSPEQSKLDGIKTSVDTGTVATDAVKTTLLDSNSILASVKSYLYTLLFATEATGAAPPSRMMQVGGWIYNANKCRAIEIDWNNSLNTMDIVHHEIHEGNSWTFTDGPTTLAAAASREILIIAGASDVHFEEVVDASLSGLLYIYEGTTYSAPGTAVTVTARNRANVQACTTLVYHTPTLTATGTLLAVHQVGTSSTGGRTGESASSDRAEWILDAGKKYLLRFTADANNTRTIIRGDWYHAHDANGGHVL